MQAAIAKYKCVIVEAKLGNEWYTAPNGQTSWAEADVLPIRPPAEIIDAHFFVIGGEYNPTDTWFANSWSEEWGHLGFGYFQANYVPYVMNAIVLYKQTPAIQTVVNHPTLTPQEKTSLIQQIIDDIEQVVSLIQQQIAQK